MERGARGRARSRATVSDRGARSRLASATEDIRCVAEIEGGQGGLFPFVFHAGQLMWTATKANMVYLYPMCSFGGKNVLTILKLVFGEVPNLMMVKSYMSRGTAAAALRCVRAGVALDAGVGRAGCGAALRVFFFTK